MRFLERLAILATLYFFVRAQIDNNKLKEFFQMSEIKDFDETELYDLFLNGSMRNYLNFDEEEILIDTLLESFPAELSEEYIGTTKQGNEIQAITLSLKDQRGDTSESSSILITGAHHAREFTSIQMTLYILLRLLFDYTNGDIKAARLLKHHKIYFIPILNIDGFMEINDYFQQYQQFLYVRKNMNIEYQNTPNQCQRSQRGVDLNRNYDFQWGVNNEGSSGKPCEEDFRGPSGFSELETLAMKNFIEQHPDIKIALNFHAYGNLFIHPFNFDTAKNPLLFEQFPEAAKVYDEIEKQGLFIPGYLSGNGKETIHYTANGEASDWMLQSHNIIAMSPELGTEDPRTDAFFISDREILKDVVQRNYPWVRSVIDLLLDKMHMSLNSIQYNFQHGYNGKIIKVWVESEIQFKIKNRGYQEIDGKFPIFFSIDNTLIEKVESLQFWNGSALVNVSVSKNEYQLGDLSSYQFNPQPLGPREEMTYTLKLKTTQNFTGMLSNEEIHQNSLIMFNYVENTAGNGDLQMNITVKAFNETMSELLNPTPSRPKANLNTQEDDRLKKLLMVAAVMMFLAVGVSYHFFWRKKRLQPEEFQSVEFNHNSVEDEEEEDSNSV